MTLGPDIDLPPEPLAHKRALQHALAAGGIVAAFGVRGSIGCGSLWSDCGFKRLLKPMGMNWNGFQDLCGGFSFLIIDWLEGKTTWNDTCSAILNEASQRVPGGRAAS